MARLLYYGQPINWASPLDRGLVSRWQVVPWYASGPRWIDLAGRNHGTLTNGPTWDGARGRQGGYGSIKFDGSNDYVALSRRVQVSAFTLGSTYAAWIRTSSTDATASYVGDPALPILSDTTGSVWIGWGVTGGVQVFMYAGGGPHASGAVTVNDDAWHFLVATHDRGTGAIALYVDGSPDGTGTRAWNSTFPAADVIGRGFNAADVWSGGLDEVRIYNRAFSASEVKALYEDSRAWSLQTLNWIRDARRMPQLGGLLTQRQWCAGLDRHWVGGLM